MRKYVAQSNGTKMGSRAGAAARFAGRIWSRLERNDLPFTSMILACVVVLVYGEVVFLGHTLSPATFSPGFLGSSGPYGYVGRRISQYPMLDAWASGLAEFPMSKLVAQYVWSGFLPLWNPYMAAGTPLAADTTYSVFSPLIILGLFANTYDIGVLVRIWLAGVFMVLFLKELRLGRAPALAGALFYMFSGSFTWYSGQSWINVSMLAPLLLYSIERLVQKRTRADVSLLSLAVFLSILGGFIETIILQFILAILYFLFRALTLGRLGKSVARFIAGFAGGLGLSSFYLLIVFEYLANSALGNPSSILMNECCMNYYTRVVIISVGQSFIPFWLFGTFFVPYIVGGPGQYWSNAMSLNQSIVTALPGYVGVLSLFLSTIAVLTLVFSRDRKLLPVAFFTSMAVLAALKTFGNPIVNWIGLLPVLKFVLFYKFLGFFWAFCFATSAAFGVKEIMKGVARKFILMSFAVSAGILAAACIVLTPFLSDPQPLSSVASGLPAWVQGIPLYQLRIYYLAWRIGEACLLLVAVACISSRVSRNRAPVWALISLIVLEMSWYVPTGMGYSQQLVQSAWMAASVFLFTLLVVRPAGLKWASVPRLPVDFLVRSASKRKRLVLVLFVVVVMVGQVAITNASPQGLPLRYDDFREPPFVQFLKQNVGYSRIYSIEYTLTSTYAGIAGLQTLGIISAFNVNTFDTFARSYLDTDKSTTVLDSQFLRPWPTGIGNASVDQLRTNMRFYDLLGVRFIIARSNLTRLLSMPLVYNGEVAIYENPHAFPRAFLVHNFTTASASEMLAQSNFDLRSEIVIEYPAGEPEPLGSAVGYRTNQEQVTITSYEPDSVVIEVQTGTAAFLVLTDTYYPGWGVRVDGRPATIYRADGLFRAVRIEAGKHTVVFTYLPDSFLAGIAISVATAFGLVAYTLRRTPALKGAHTSRNRQVTSSHA